MANFNEAYNITLKHEGGYSNDSDDAGGETYKGISRRYNPSWEGWVLIDQYKQHPNFPNSAYNDSRLDKMVKDFYKDHYWDVNLLDEFNSQNIANEMFDTGVNLGVGSAAKFLQMSLNVLNKNGTKWDDMTVDSKIGTSSLKALNACLSLTGDEVLFKVMNILQGMHYVETMNKSKTQEKYAYGWLSRVNFIKG